MILSSVAPRVLLGIAIYPIPSAPSTPPPPPAPIEQRYPSLGRLLLAGYAEQPEQAVLRTDMESGPAKQITVRSRVLVTRPVSYYYTSAQYQGFKAWHRDALNRGANWFDWLDPIDGQVKLARIVAAPGQPAYDARAVSAREGDLLAWEVSFQLETWG